MTLFKIFLIAFALFSLAIPLGAVELVKGEYPVELHILLHIRGTIFGTSRISVYSESKVYSGFLAKRGEIKLEGSLNEKKINWVFMVEPVSLASKIVQDAYVSLQYIPYLDIKFGQFKYPQNFDGRLSNSKLVFVERSLLGKTFGTKRDVGIELGYNHKYIEYALGLINGSGQNTADNNEKKDWMGRVLIKPNPYINFGGSIYRGRQPSGVTERTAAELKFNYKNLALQSEYQAGKDSSLERWGLYLQGAYVIAKNFQACVRGEIWEPSKNNMKDKMYITTLGFNYFLKGEGTKIAVNYTLVTEESNEVDNNELVIQWQLAF